MYRYGFWLTGGFLFLGAVALLFGSRTVVLAGVRTPVTCTETDKTVPFPVTVITCSPTPAPQQACDHNVIVTGTYCPTTSIAVPHDCPPPYAFTEHYGSKPAYGPCGTSKQCVDGGYAPEAIGCPEDSTASVSVTVQVVDQSGQQVAGAALSGNSFLLAGQEGEAPITAATDASGQVTFAFVGSGNYLLTEQPASGAGFTSMNVNGVAVAQNQAFQVQPGKPYVVTVTNTSSLSNGS